MTVLDLFPSYKERYFIVDLQVKGSWILDDDVRRDERKQCIHFVWVIKRTSTAWCVSLASSIYQT
jgi:hypothetical protein